MTNTNIVLFHPEDLITRKVVSGVLNNSHSGRIRQNTLNFWRNLHKTFKDLSSPSSTYLLVAILDNIPVGLSGIEVVGNNHFFTRHSFTAVHPDNRNLNIGTQLLISKKLVLSTIYKDINFNVYVAASNQYAISMCLNAGFNIVKEFKNGTKHYYVFS